MLFYHMTTEWVLAFIVFLVLPPFPKAMDWQDNEGGPIRWATDCDFKGRGTSEKQLNSFQKCGDLCLETQNCDHFTWTDDDEQGGVCKMKYSNYTVQESRMFEKLAVNQNGSVCGFLQISWNKDVNNTSLGIAEWAYNCVMLGLSTSRLLPPQISKEEECGVVCRNISDCKGFTWKPQSRLCEMTTGGNVSRDAALYDPHSFCGYILDRYGQPSAYNSWLVILLAIFCCSLVFLIIIYFRTKLINQFCSREGSRHQNDNASNIDK